jgi:hypothetical protein
MGWRIEYQLRVRQIAFNPLRIELPGRVIGRETLYKSLDRYSLGLTERPNVCDRGFQPDRVGLGLRGRRRVDVLVCRAGRRRADLVIERRILRSVARSPASAAAPIRPRRRATPGSPG